MSKTPTLIWAQRVEKVFVTWESLATKEVNVTFSEGLLTIEGTLANGDVYKLENLPLFLEIEPEESKWFKNDRSVVISLKKKTAEWWDAFSKDKSYKRFIKTDFSKWCEEEDREYMGDFGPADDMGGMGGMGGMDFGGMGMGGMGMDGMGGMGNFGDSDDEDEGDLGDLGPSDLPPLEDDGPPPLESSGNGDEGPPALEPDISQMKEVD
mmetsp:Transcript_21853/g.55615  ORF Transcript_21853/g.55615 Transcript_21853/m.55615 type:complete len:209 (+) Transcript_21853:40-666(+)